MHEQYSVTLAVAGIIIQLLTKSFLQFQQCLILVWKRDYFLLHLSASNNCEDGLA